MDERPALLVSACLVGLNCRYDGGCKALEALDALAARYRLIPLCPEQLGGLPTPRPPAERRDGGVFTRDGGDVTEAFDRGAEMACRVARLTGARLALLKARSPSCGRGAVYDGGFSGRLVPGDGVAAEALARMGVAVYTEAEADALIAALPIDGKQ